MTLRRRLDSITVSTDMAYTACYCSLRYALGRRTNAVPDVCSLVRHLARRLDAGQIEVLIRDVQEHGDYWERAGHPRMEAYGSECDWREWMSLLEWLRDERARRES